MEFYTVVRIHLDWHFLLPLLIYTSWATADLTVILLQPIVSLQRVSVRLQYVLPQPPAVLLR